MVLADGHHRFETAGNYRAERAAAGADDPGADAIMTLVVELAPEQLCVRAIHRLLTGIGGPGGGDLRAALAGPFRVHAAGPNVAEGVAALETAMRDAGALGLVDRDGLALLLPTAELDTRMQELPVELHDVDSARFDAGVLPAVPGVTLTYRNDAATVAARVEKGDADAAVLLRPVTVETIRAAAAASTAHAREDDVLRAEAAHRHGVPQPRPDDRERSPASGLPLVDFPGGAGAEELVEVAGTLTLHRADQLALHLGLVGGPLDRAEHAHRRGHRRRRRQAGQRERQRRVCAGLVVHEEAVLAHVGDLDDLALTELVEDHAALVVGAEADRLAVAQLDEHVGARFLGGDPLERAVVEDVAVLVDLDERAALVLVRAPERLEHAGAVHVVGAGHERGLRRRARPTPG